MLTSIQGVIITAILTEILTAILKSLLISQSQTFQIGGVTLSVPSKVIGRLSPSMLTEMLNGFVPLG